MILITKIFNELNKKDDVIRAHQTASNKLIKKVIIITDYTDIKINNSKISLLHNRANDVDTIEYIINSFPDRIIIWSESGILIDSFLLKTDQIKSKSIVLYTGNTIIFNTGIKFIKSNSIINSLIGNKIDISNKPIRREVSNKSIEVSNKSREVSNKSREVSNKSIKISKIETIIVSVDYNDVLIISLENNIKYLDSITVVTSTKDTICQEICKKFGVNCVITDSMYENGSKFNKGKAINVGIRSLKNPDWVLLLDADILLTSSIDKDTLDKNNLYTSSRYICDYESYKKWSNGEIEISEIGYLEEDKGFGFFHLYNVNNRNLYHRVFGILFPEKSNDAGWSDVSFRNNFKSSKSIEKYIIHIGQTGVNWSGRKSEKVITDLYKSMYKSTYTICSYYFNFKNDIRQKNNFIKFLEQFKDHYEKMIVGIIDYGDIDFEIPCKSIIIKGDVNNKLWSKEILINKIIDITDTDYLLWIDGDIIYNSLDWIDNIDNVVGENDFVQLFEDINYLGENNELLESHKSIISNGLKNIDSLLVKGYKPGGSWLGKVSILKDSKLFEKMYVGGGDTIFAYGLFNINNGFTLGKVGEGSKEIQNDATEWINRFGKYKVGYLNETVNHLYHGDLKDRNYNDRYRLLVNKVKYYSIVIPTMWKSDKISKMLPIYDSCEYIKEIIVIDNNPDDKIDISSYKKIIYYTEGSNIFVNPSWNKGFSISKYNLLLINDDLIIENFHQILNLISNSNLDIIGVDVNNFGQSYIEELNCSFPGNSFGCLMYVKRYKYIPDQLKIWYGDDIQYSLSNSKGIIRNANIKTNKSETINSNISEFRNKVGKNDIEEYKILYNNPKSDDTLNIIIRTSGRPKYFKTCIESIKKYVKDYKLHISIDNTGDMEYVKDILKNIDFSYYIIDKQVISDICDKIKIQRNKFIYNYYYNVISDYLSGWCMYLDDDDQIVDSPYFTNDHSKIFIHKVDIGKKIVPSKLEGRPILNDISGISTIFHSSIMGDWMPQRGGDFDFISNLYDISNAVYVNKIIAKGISLDFNQDVGGNFGNQKDIYIDKKISVNLATYPARKKSLKKVIESLLDNNIIDIIRVYMNEYEDIPDDLPKCNRIIYHVGGENLMDSGKFFWAGDKKDEYYFTVDDDLIYPQIYFIRHIGLLKKYNNDIFISLHGKVMNEYPKVFNDCIKSYHCLNDVEYDVFINNPGTGVLLFDNSKYNIEIDLFKQHGMADLYISLFCQKENIAILCRKHSKDEIYHILNDDTLFERRYELNKKHQIVLNEIGKWNLKKK